MEPSYFKDYVRFNEPGVRFDRLLKEVNWVNPQQARKECFMSEVPREYQYIENGPVYKSVEFHPLIDAIMKVINAEYGFDLNVCFLNYYADQTKALGWHADDAEQIDQGQPIAVVSFGEPREIWWKPKAYKGTIPEEWRQKLADGSLFIMPAGFQNEYLHRIPKGDREMGGRISLTYRSWKG